MSPLPSAPLAAVRPVQDPAVLHELFPALIVFASLITVVAASLLVLLPA